MSTGKLKKDLALLTRSRTQRPGSFRTIVRVVISGQRCCQRILPGSFTTRGRKLQQDLSRSDNPNNYSGCHRWLRTPGPESLAARKLQPGDSRAA